MVKQRFIHCNREGFTLLELLVSAGVLALVSVIIAQVMFTTVRLSVRTELMKELKQTGTTSMETMKRLIQNAKSVSTVCDGTPTTELGLVNFDGGETVLRCVQDTSYTNYEVYRIASYSALLGINEYVSSGNVSLVTGSDSTAGCGYANSSDAALYFVCSSDAQGITITATFHIRQQNSKTGAFEGNAENFQSLTIMRNVNQ